MSAITGFQFPLRRPMNVLAALRLGRGSFHGVKDRDGPDPLVYPALLLATGACAWRLLGPETFLDDAWISFRVARNWLESGALTYDAARAPVEGVTNLLWTLLSAAWIALLPGVDPALPARAVGLACHVATVCLLARLAARVAGSAGANATLAAAVAGGLAATSTSLAYHAMGGLETALWGLLFVVALDRGLAAVRGDGPAALATGALLGLLAWTRPEGVLAGGCAILALAVWPGQRGVALLAAAPFAALVLGLETFRWLVYGSLVPNTFHAKPPDPASGLVYLRGFWLYGLGVLGPLATLPALRRWPFARVVALVCGLLVGGAVWSGGDWMPGFRRLTLPTLGFCLLAGAGVAAARGRWRPVAFASIAAVLAGHAVLATTLPQRTFDHRGAERLGALAEAAEGVDQVALADIGVFGWHFRGSVFDLAGLTDRHIARLPGRHGRKEWDEAYFRERSPDLVLVVGMGRFAPPLDEEFRVRPFELGVLRSLVTEGGYRYYKSFPEGGDRILVFPREDVVLDPTLWGPPDERDLLAELRAFRERRLAGHP